MSTEIKYEIKPFNDSPGTPTVKVFLRDLRNLGNKKGDDFGWTLTDNLDGVDAGGGEIRWLADWTRPDISYVASKLGCFMQSPEAEHLQAAYKVIGYLVSTKSLGITYGGMA